MFKLLKTFLLFTLFSIITSSNANAQFGGLLKQVTGGDLGALTGQQTEIVQTLVNGLTEYTNGQSQVAKALGLKKQVDILDSEQDALSSGNVKDKKSIQRSMKVSTNAQKAIDKKIAEGSEISAEAKVEFRKALPYYARGTASSIALVPQVISWGSGATNAVKSGGMMGGLKIAKSLGTGIFLVKNLPGYVTSAKKSYGTMMAFSKKNEIDTSEAESLLGDDL